MNYLFDTSALTSFLFQEPGYEKIKKLISNGEASFEVSVLTLGEFGQILFQRISEPVHSQYWELIESAFDHFHPVTEQIVREMLNLRRHSQARLPMIDALIAASAVMHGATLVHRDKHFSSIPARFLKQIYVG
jgi:predicted nucleic acid-binding protein